MMDVRRRCGGVVVTCAICAAAGSSGRVSATAVERDGPSQVAQAGERASGTQSDSEQPVPAGDPLELVKQGRALNAAGKQDEALTLYARALERQPDLFDAHLASGIALDLKGDYPAARTHLAKALEHAPEGAREPAFSAMAVSYAFEANAKEAAVFYQRLLDQQMAGRDFTGAAATANALGRVYLESGDPANALEWYRTGYETARRQPDLPASELEAWDMRWHHAQARIAARRGDHAEAEKQVVAVKASVEKGGPASDQWPVYQYAAGYALFYRHDYAGAARELMKGDLKDPFILSLIAQAFEKQGDAARATEYYARVLRSNAHNIQNAFSRPLARKRVATPGSTK